MSEQQTPQINEELQSKEGELEALQEIQKNSNDVLEKELVNSEGEKKKIKDIILGGDIYTRGDKIIFRHGGILRMIEFVGAEPLDPQPINSYLNKDSSGFVFYCPIKFPSGEISRWGMGEANEQNTDSFGSSYKANQAIIRGFARSFLHSKYVGLYDVYSEGEADDFNQQIQQITELNRQIHLLEKQIQSLKGRNKLSADNNSELGVQLNLMRAIALFPPAEELILPSDDERYPNQSIITVLTVFKDGKYAGELMSKLKKEHPIHLVLKFLQEKAQIDKNNNKRYNLYETALKLLTELRLSKGTESASEDVESTQTADAFLSSEVSSEETFETETKETITEDNENEDVTQDSITESAQPDSVEESKDEESLPPMKTESKTESKPIKKETEAGKNQKNPLSFLDDIDYDIVVDDIAEMKHEPISKISTESEKEATSSLFEEDASKKTINKNESKSSEPPVKRGPGRPRKNPSDKPKKEPSKRGPGRPKKNSDEKKQ